METCLSEEVRARVWFLLEVCDCLGIEVSVHCCEYKLLLESEEGVLLEHEELIESLVHFKPEIVMLKRRGEI